jgi:hypothetical protein
MMHHPVSKYTAEVYDRSGQHTGRITFHAEDSWSKTKILAFAEFVAEGEDGGFGAEIRDITRVSSAA